MWSDTETEVDLLGFAVHKDLVRDLVTNESLLPLTVGIFGDWGGGKSSVMRMLWNDLRKDKGIACLYFQSWVFEGYDDAKAALISAILAQLAEDRRFDVKVRKNAARMIKRVDFMRTAKALLKVGPFVAHGAAGLGLIDHSTALAITGATVAGGGLTAIVPGLSAGGAGNASGQDDEDADDDANGFSDGDDWGTGGIHENERDGGDSASEAHPPGLKKLLREDRSRPDILDVRSFRRDFGKLIAETKLKSLVVLIDDLDRCSPDRLIETLEAIKLFLAVPKTAFVIAADERIVRHAIATRYAAPRLSGEQTGREDPYNLENDYLEKVIQIPYRLPRLSPSEIESYVTLLFCQLELRQQPDLFRGVLVHCSAQREADLRKTYGSGLVREHLAHNMPKALEERLQWTGKVAPALNEGLKGNPRQVKRFLNAVLLRKRLAEIARLSIRDDVLVKLMLLEYSRGDLFDELYLWQAMNEGFPQQLAQLERAASALASERGSGYAPDGVNAGWQEKPVQQWLRMEPQLADVDLRDYFWVARDRISGTLTGLTTVPLVVQTLASSLTSGVESDRKNGAKAALTLDPSDRAILIRLLGTGLQRKPREQATLEGFIALVEASVPGSLESFASTLKEIPSNDLPANVGYEIERLIKEDAGKNGALVHRFQVKIFGRKSRR